MKTGLKFPIVFRCPRCGNNFLIKEQDLPEKNTCPFCRVQMEETYRFNVLTLPRLTGIIAPCVN